MASRLSNSQISVLFALILLPSFLNDFANIFLIDYECWLAVDYGHRLLQIGILVLLAATGRLNWEELGLGKINILQFLNYSLLFGLVAYVLGPPFFLFLSETFPQTNLGTIPFDPASPLYVFDMTFGLFLVGFSEEVITRGLGFSVLQNKSGTAWAFWWSSILFALIHWSNGIPSVINSFFIGAVYCIARLRTGTVWPTIAAHVLYNFLYYKFHIA